MRATVTINSTADTMPDALVALADEWKRITKDSRAVLPTDAEISFESYEDDPGAAKTYYVKFVARTKIEHGVENG